MKNSLVIFAALLIALPFVSSADDWKDKIKKTSVEFADRHKNELDQESSKKAQKQAEEVLEVLETTARGQGQTDWVHEDSRVPMKFLEIVRLKTVEDPHLDPEKTDDLKIMGRLFAAQLVYGEDSPEHKKALEDFSSYRDARIGSISGATSVASEKIPGSPPEFNDRGKVMLADQTGAPSNTAPAVPRAKDGHAWILRRIVDYDGKEKAEKANSKSKVWKVEVNYSRGSVTIKKTYLGATDKNSNPPHVEGSTISVRMQWSAPPQIIYAEEEVSLSVSVGLAARSHQWPDSYGHVFTQIVAVGSDGITAGGELGKFYNAVEGKPGDYWFTTGYRNKYKSFDETTFSKLRAGRKPGELIGIRTSASDGGSGSARTLYVYEWNELSKLAELGMPEAESVGKNKSAKPTNAKWGPGPKYIWEGDRRYQDSGVRVSDLSGDVQIRHADNPIGWEFMEQDTVICVGDIIKTEDDSECILSLSDMTTFHMKPSSVIVMNTESEKKSKIALLAGKVWVNVKKMVLDGSMSVEMSQAVAGIKGTVFIVESDETTSKLRVIEGKVKLTGKKGGAALVGPGQQVTAINGVLGEVGKFSVSAELDTLKGPIKTKFQSDIQKRIKAGGSGK